VQVFLGIIDLELLKVRIAVEKLLVIRDAIIFNLSFGTHQTIGQPAHMGLPVADEKIEVVRTVASWRWRWLSHRGEQHWLQ
jgi:hypothetical protein